MTTAKTLYLCYFGLREPLVQTQVLPYLREIAKDGIKIFLLTFEQNPEQSWSSEDISQTRSKLGSEGIFWSFLTYHKKPSLPATVYDIFCGAFFAWKLARREEIDVFHGRVHVPMMMGWIASKFLFRKPKLLFDIRGFFPEEYVDAGIWTKQSFAYKVVKYCEKLLLRDADGFVVLTEKAREILFPESYQTGFDKVGRPVEVIPCCVDTDRFSKVNENIRQQTRLRLNLQNRLVIAYVGSFGGFYMENETADFLGYAKKKHPELFALVLTQTPKERILPLLQKQGFDESDYFIQKVSPQEIPDYLSAADLAVSFIKPAYSKLSSSPTKNAEYLAMGLPLIANSKVGDVKEHIENNKIGCVVESFSDSEYEKALNCVANLVKSEEFADRCRNTAAILYGLQSVGGTGYRRIYDRILK